MVPGRIPDLVIINNNKKDKNCCMVDFAIPADDTVKIKESEKEDKYLDLARELRNLRGMRVTVIPIVIGVLGTVPKELGRSMRIQTTTLLRSTRILSRVLEISRDFMPLRPQ